MVCDQNGLILPKNNAGLCVLPLFGTLMLINWKPDLKKKTLVNIECIFFLTIGTKWYEIDIILQEYNLGARKLFPEASTAVEGWSYCNVNRPHKGSRAH